MRNNRLWPLLFTLLGAISLPCHAQSAAKSTGQPTLLVANQGDRTLSLIDPQAGQQTAAIPENEITGHEVAASPDGRTAYVPIYGNSGVGKPGTDGRKMLAIDLETRKITGTVDFGHGVRPHCAVFDTNHNVLYVTTELDNTVTVIDPHTLKIVGTVPTAQPEAHMLAISHDGQRGYTANVGPGTVSVLDLPGRKNIAVIPISANTQRISISPDDSMVFTADQTKPQLAVIDTATNKVKSWVPLASPGYGTAPTKDGRYLLVAVPKASHVAVVDLSTLKVTRTLDVPSAPQEVLVRPDGKMAYVSCNASHKVAAINLTDWKVEKLIDAGKGADGLAWANPASKQSISKR
jgi:YVTN family beta-propeller protein